MKEKLSVNFTKIRDTEVRPVATRESARFVDPEEIRR